jgi:putative FmdB family regulatory protein
VPIYEYQCRKCRERLERIQGISDPPLRKCPSCGGGLDRLMSPGAFVLKGSGWYKTDYAGKGNGGGREDSRRGKDGKEAPSCPASAKDASPACAGCPKAE